MNRLQSFLLTTLLALAVVGFGGWLAVQGLEYWEQRQTEAAIGAIIECALTDEC